MGKICKNPKSPINDREKRTASQRIIGVILHSHGLADTIRLLQYAIEDQNKETLLPGAEIDPGAIEKAIKINELLDAAYYTAKKELDIKIMVKRP